MFAGHFVLAHVFCAHRGPCCRRLGTLPASTGERRRPGATHAVRAENRGDLSAPGCRSGSARVWCLRLGKRLARIRGATVALVSPSACHRGVGHYFARYSCPGFGPPALLSFLRCRLVSKPHWSSYQVMQLPLPEALSADAASLAAAARAPPDQPPPTTPPAPHAPAAPPVRSPRGPATAPAPSASDSAP